MRSRGRGHYPGRLIVVEGCDGSGKSTQVRRLKGWLEAQGYPVYFTTWNSSELVHPYIKAAKKNGLLTPTTFSLIHACDFADRFEQDILPHLQAGYLVLADRYLFTALARDVARGCDPNWVRAVYHSALTPDRTFYFSTAVEVSLDRILAGRPELKYYEAGMDLGRFDDPIESFLHYQGLVKQQYDQMAAREDFIVVDAALPIADQHEQVREIVAADLRDYSPPLALTVAAAAQKGRGEWSL